MSDKLSQEQIEEYKEAFNLVDHDNDGVLTIRELDVAMRSLGYNLTNDELETMVNTKDRQEKGGITLEEFYTAMQKRTLTVQMEDGVREAFKLYDKDQDGLMTETDVKSVMKTLGETVSDEEARTMISRVDRNNDGKITSDEFARLLVLN
jgi:calmodulin